MNQSTTLTERLRHVVEKQIELLGRFKVECVVVGGVAATLHGSQIPTTDIDVWVVMHFAQLISFAPRFSAVISKTRYRKPFKRFPL